MDPISNMLSAINNAQKVGHEFIEAPFSKVKFELAKILQKANFVESADKAKAAGHEILRLKLKYSDGAPAISGLKRISKPGCRIYIGVEKIRPIKQGYGKIIISTSRGLMLGEAAKRNKLGGEVICEIW